MSGRSGAITAAAFLLLAALTALPNNACARNAMVTFEVIAPEGTPPDASVFISGNIPALGPWDPGKVKLGQIGERKHAITLMLPPGLDFRYKFTRGTWETVEKGRWFEEIPDRELHVIGDETLVVRVENWRDYSGAREAHTVTGDIRRHERFASAVLGNSRTLLVYLPPGYEDEERSYPVLYMHDGQNLFDVATSFIGVEWNVDETLERMIPDEEVEPIIVVGIYNTPEREFEYTPVQDSSRGKGGGADRYAAFIINEVKPFIDATYRTKPGREDTGIMGSSLGGIASLYIAWTHPDIFSRVGAMSTAYWWANDHILSVLEDLEPPPGVRVWLDMGTGEDSTDRNRDDVPDIIEQHRRARNILMEKGLTIPRRLRYVEDEGAVHNERAWASRFPGAVAFLFPKR
ncbi:MAG: esterase [Candidatus Eisenbacteria bacterium]|nr:esterase [Candidatus Eisenbacteria bacterium]